MDPPGSQVTFARPGPHGQLCRGQLQRTGAATQREQQGGGSGCAYLCRGHYSLLLCSLHLPVLRPSQSSLLAATPARGTLASDGIPQGCPKGRVEILHCLHPWQRHTTWHTMGAPRLWLKMAYGLHRLSTCCLPGSAEHTLWGHKCMDTSPCHPWRAHIWWGQGRRKFQDSVI